MNLIDEVNAVDFVIFGFACIGIIFSAIIVGVGVVEWWNWYSPWGRAAQFRREEEDK